MDTRFLVCAAMVLAGCGRAPPAVSLPAPPGVAYTVILKTYKDGDHADQPFKLLVRTPSDDEPSHILMAPQCKNVEVAQTAKLLYVFYDELELASFGSFTDGKRPRPILCDMKAPHCEALRAELASKTPLVAVCSYRTNDR